MQLEASAPSDYLGCDAFVQSDHPAVIELGDELRRRHHTEVGFARAAFDWVRDNVAHAYDAQDPRVTLTAVEALTERVGLCYVKSHLLAALLRSQGIPAGLCYQRLGDPVDGYVLHGLAAVHVEGAWHRQDPRGNKPGVNAQFSLEGEQLAFTVDEDRGEIDYPQVYASPPTVVVEALRGAENILTCSLPSELP